jgi:hypothetical protein
MDSGQAGNQARQKKARSKEARRVMFGSTIYDDFCDSANVLK